MIEIERRFLLKQLPKGLGDYKEISQKYFNNNGVYERIRRIHFPNIKYNHFNYEHIIKTNISPGINNEEHRVIDSNLFHEINKRCTKEINKRRYLYRIGNLTWEVDHFFTMNLVIAEVELEDLNQELMIPKIIQNEIIMEVTEFPQFSNFNLAESIRE